MFTNNKTNINATLIISYNIFQLHLFRNNPINLILYRLTEN